MEKKLLLAVALSFMVLYVWSALSPRPQSRQPIFDSQLVETKEIMTKEEYSSPSLSPVVNASFSEKVFVEESHVLENEKLRVQFSNKGGSIQRITIKEYDKTLPIRNLFDVVGFQDSNFKLVYVGSNKISYILENDDLRIERDFYISLDDYIITSDIEIVYKSGMSKLNNMNITALVLDMSNLNEDISKRDPTYARDRTMFEYVIKENSKIIRKNNAYKFGNKEKVLNTGNIDWIGFRDRYFCVIVKPDFPTISYAIDPINDNVLKLSLTNSQEDLGVGESIKLHSTIFVGPENTSLLKSYGLGFEEIKKFYKFNLFDAIAKIIYSLLHLIQKVIPNWGMCIVIISVIIYFSMYPLTLRGMNSMKKMQSMQPKIAILKEKYKGNPQKMNKEMMEMYKEHKINPLGGCLPFFCSKCLFL